VTIATLPCGTGNRGIESNILDKTPAFPISNCVIENRYTIRGSSIGTGPSFKKALMFAAAGKVKTTIETVPLESINEVFARLRNGKLQGHIVLGITEKASAERFRRTA
jgi:D-arabinose 1-dehydrogenase-like Zn-dependent alcohol dehydrogenase